MYSLHKSLRLVASLLSIGMALEVAAYPKPGNVHRLHDFHDTKFEDFLVASCIAVPNLLIAVARGFRGMFGKIIVGDIIYRIVKDSKTVTKGGNTCLGTAILLSTLALGVGNALRKGSTDVFDMCLEATSMIENHSTVWDTVYLYKAIRVAAPSYIRPEDNVYPYPNVWNPNFVEEIVNKGFRLWDVVVYAAEKDIVFRELVESFRRSMDASQFLAERMDVHGDWNRSVVETYLYLLSKYLDSVVMRKHGVDTAVYVRRRASEVLQKTMYSDDWFSYVKEFDEELSNRKINPGSIADLTAVSISLYALSKRVGILRSSR